MPNITKKEQRLKKVEKLYNNKTLWTAPSVRFIANRLGLHATQIARDLKVLRQYKRIT